MTPVRQQPEVKHGDNELCYPPNGGATATTETVT